MNGNVKNGLPRTRQSNHFSEADSADDNSKDSEACDQIESGHALTVAGISGNEKEGCWLIALSGAMSTKVIPSRTPAVEDEISKAQKQIRRIFALRLSLRIRLSLASILH
jgi:hypothetical protein